MISVLAEPHAIDTVALTLDTPNMATRQTVIAFLDKLCHLGTIGHQLVLESLSYFQAKKLKNGFYFIYEPLEEDETLDFHVSLQNFLY